MTTQNKVDGLNNLEAMYGQITTYIDAITHATSYYTDAQAAAIFFTSVTDGHTSGLICSTLDGYTSQQIQDAGTPSGCIGIWSSTVGSIPSGWYLCSGSNGTPNLQDRFIVGSGSNYSYGNTGGSDTATSAASITIAGHALAAAEIPLHTHGSITDNYPAGTTTASAYGTQSNIVETVSDIPRETTSTGSGSSHGHTASWAGTANQDKRSPFYALCYIMRA